MRLLRSYLFQALLTVVAVVSMQSCSCEKRETVADKIDYAIPGDAAIVLAGDVSRFFDALDVTVKDGVPVLPKYLSDCINMTMSQGDRRDIEKALTALKGVGYTNGVLGIRCNDNFQALFVFDVEDEDEFVKSVSTLDEDFETGSADGFDTVGDDNFNILVKDHLGYLVIRNARALTGSDAAEVIGEWTKAAAESPLADWKKTYLSEPRVGRLLISMEPLAAVVPANAKAQLTDRFGELGLDMDIWSMNIGMTFDLEGNTATLSSTVFDAAGSQIANPYVGKFDNELVKYAGESDIIAASLCYNEKGLEISEKSLNSAIESMERYQAYGYYDSNELQLYKAIADGLPVIAGYVSDGGVFMSAGLSATADVSNFDMADFSNYHFVVAAALRPDKATEAYDAVCGELAKSAVAERNGNEGLFTFSVDLGYDDRTGTTMYAKVPVYVELHGATLVISNEKPVKGTKNNFDPAVFDGSGLAIQVSIPENYPALAMFNFHEGVNSSLTMKGSECVLKVSLLGAGDKFVPGLVGMINDFGN